MSLDELKRRETELDAQFQSLPIWKLPIRAILATLHSIVDGLFHGGAARAEAGATLASRLSYLIPQILKSECGLKGECAADALGAVQEVDPHGSDRRFLAGYAHLCELMPEVHRGYYIVSKRTDGAFRLVHKSEEFAAHEVTDIVMTELSLAFLRKPAPSLDDLYDFQAARGTQHDLAKQFFAWKLLHQHYFDHLVEPTILSDSGYQDAVGMSAKEFRAFRAGLHAQAHYCRGIASAFGRRIEKEGPGNGLREEILEWISVNWKETFFLGTLQALSGVAPDSIDRAIALFTIDCRPGHVLGASAGDGFFPPLARFEESYLFNPDVLQLFLTPRNVPYALNKMDKPRFDQLVSQDLEPSLLKEFESTIARFKGLVMIRGATWKGGEMDLLVYSPLRNNALHVQAKAAIPPHGARSVRAIEARTAEGLKQLAGFRQLPSSARDEILSRALATSLINVDVHDVLLTSSSIGTEVVWSQLGQVIPVSPPLLRLALKRIVGDEFNLAELSQLVWDELGDIKARAKPTWIAGDVRVGDVTIEVPLLNLDNEELAKARARSHM